ncbi:MAG: M15 family metallopeptidase [Actinobacteria bacterium]|nr:M15 family metallopeptidase [Actinomycetota bacterium]
MRAGAVARTLAAASVGFVLGAVVTLSVQSEGVTRPGSKPERRLPEPVTVPEGPETFLAWTPGGLPAGFGRSVASLPRIERAVVVASDNTWLTRSLSAKGEVVDDPPDGYAIPLEVAAVDPRDFAPFLPPADRGAIVSLADGQGVLGASSAELRGLGPGAVLEFGTSRVEIAAVLPDELVGAHELLVSRRVGLEIGVRRDRYALLQPGRERSSDRLRRELDRILPPGLSVRVRAPGETPYFRQGDAVLPPVRIKMLFGEFAARPSGGFLDVDPAWVNEHIATERVPLLGKATCNVALFPQLVGAMQELERRGLGDLVRTFHGCYAPRFVNRVPTAALSHHSWGIAIDINLQGNGFGEPPHQDPRLVHVMERWGFIWGGRFIVPDGNHFEYRRPPAE